MRGSLNKKEFKDKDYKSDKIISNFKGLFTFYIQGLISCIFKKIKIILWYRLRWEVSKNK